MVYDLAEDEKRQLCEAKVESQFARATRYVETIAARAVVPSAGPPAFLDDDLFHLNAIRGGEPSIFRDQRSFLARLAAAGHAGILAIPGTEIEVTPDDLRVRHPISEDEVAAIFEDKESYLRRYQADWRPWLDELKAGWSAPRTDLKATLEAWWEPLLRMAPTLCAAVGANCLLRAGDVELIVDFQNAEVRSYRGDPYAFRFDLPRDLVEIAVADRAADWSNSLFLSCRWSGWREGGFSFHLANFFKSLSVERMSRAEAEAIAERSAPRRAEAEIELGDYVVQRRCPHRNADLRVFGEIEEGPAGARLVCTMHGWRFDCHTGRCLSAAAYSLRIRPREVS
jgi:UDP-MurNAc hydroxylase